MQAYTFPVEENLAPISDVYSNALLHFLFNRCRAAVFTMQNSTLTLAALRDHSVYRIYSKAPES